MADHASPRVVIIGAGIGGLIAGIHLRRKLGRFDNFTIYERSTDIGGTWHSNTYPGCASDVATHWYSLSTDLNPNWATSHVSQPDLLAYWKSLAKKYNLYSNLVCGTNVVSAEWDDDQQIYKVTVQDVKSKETREDFANIVISATGIFSTPRYPEVMGMENFKGAQFHSFEWDHDIDYHDKRVAVIGNACSAAQFMSSITDDPTTSVVNFCRSPQWIYVPPSSTRISDFQRWMFAHIPFALRLYRWWVYLQNDLFYVGYLGAHETGLVKQKITKDLTKQMTALAPQKYHDTIIPDFPVGCKRIVFGASYLKALHRPNMEINYDGIQEISEDGIVTKKGIKMSFDVIIYATGFDMMNYPLAIRGRNNISMKEYYNQKGGPQAYYGTMLPEFPNLYILCGPNSTGHGSVIFTEETQMDWAMQLITPVLNKQVSLFEPTEAATEKYNQMLQTRLERSIWAAACNSWYRPTPQGKIHTNYPGPSAEFWWNMRQPVWRDFKIIGGDRWMNRRRIRRVATNAFRMVIFFAVPVLLWNGLPGSFNKGDLISYGQSLLVEVSDYLKYLKECY
ncbi:FAD-binding Monooxygenase Superfamily protein [Abortiporus biennis]